MSFQLQAFKANGVRSSGATRQHATQVVEFYINGLTTDLALDFASLVTGSLGTFWTQVTTDATYGSIGQSALAVMQGLVNNIRTLVNLGGTPIKARTQGSGYTTVAVSGAPILNIAWVSTGPSTSPYFIVMEFALYDGLEPVTADYGQAF